MPTVHKEILVHVAPDVVWDAVSDVGALHTRLVPGFVTNVEMVVGAQPPVRDVTFASGMVLREHIVTLDNAARRLVWTIESDQVRHHNGAMQVHPAQPGWSRVVWVADVLPQAMADAFDPLMGQGMEIMKAHLERVR
jgi:Polyketide cyclase / dehydrase and lipid transport